VATAAPFDGYRRKWGVMVQNVGVLHALQPANAYNDRRGGKHDASKHELVLFTFAKMWRDK